MTMTARRVTLALALAGWGLLFWACQTPKGAVSLDRYLEPEYWRRQALEKVIPFWGQTRDAQNGGYFTDVMRDGTVKREVGKYPRMESRMVYGYSVAYLLSGDDKYLESADHALKYLTQYGWDEKNGGWYLYRDKDNRLAGDEFQKNSLQKDLFDQTYGALGPALYFVATHDKRALEYTRRTHRLIQSKAWDPEYGGYFSEVSASWEPITSRKSFNAQVDTCTAYLIYTYLATRDAALLKDFTRIADVISTRMVDAQTAFVGETFSDDWRSTENVLWVGHNLKTGWVLLRAYWLTGDKKYSETAQRIAAAQLAHHWDQRYGGWYFLFDGRGANRPADARPIWTNPQNKDWWTQTEGNFLMLNLYRLTADAKHLQVFKETARFWDAHLIDHRYGEVYPTTAANGDPVRTQKGDPFKSAYHTMEHALFNYLYLSFYVKKVDAELFFRLSADTDGEKHYVKLVEDPKVILKRVELDGKEWKRFDSKEGYIVLPRGRNMKVRAVLGT